MAERKAIGLTPLAPFDPLSDPTSLGQRWKAWKQSAQKIEDAAQKRALLLYQVGEATQDIFDTLADTGDDYDTAIMKLDEYFTPRRNLDYEVFKFRNTAQNTGETIDQYTTRLRKLARNCEFADIDRELKSTIIQNCLPKRLRRVALRDDLTLDALLAKARSIETSELQASGMEKTSSESANKVQFRKPPPPRKPPTTRSTQCHCCGLAWPHKDGPCPAKGQTCKACGKPNHYARMCRSKPTVPPKGNRNHNHCSQPKQNLRVTTNRTGESDSSDDEYLYTLGNPAKAKTPMISVSVNDVPVRMMIDTGASTDILDENSFSSVKSKGDIELLPPTKRIFAYGSDSQLQVLVTNLCVETQQVHSTMHVIQGNHDSLLSYKDSQ